MAEKKSASSPQYPTAPSDVQHNTIFPNAFNRPPPPSYEESQKIHQQPIHPAAHVMSYPSAGIPPMTNPYMQQHPQIPFPQQNFGYTYNPPPHYPNSNMQQQPITGSINLTQQSGISPVVVFDASARFHGKGAGSLTIPPPPPGCAPTPEQLAALNGQPVVLKQKKRGFF